MRLLLNIGLQVGATQTQDAQTQAEMDAYDARTWLVFCVLIVMLFVTGVTAWGIVS